MRRADRECRKRWKVPTGSERAKLESTSFYDEVLRREDEKREHGDRGPDGRDERIPWCYHSREIGVPHAYSQPGVEIIRIE